MKKYSPLKKGILIVVNLLMVMILIVSVMLELTVVQEANGSVSNIDNDGGFGKSITLSNMLDTQTYYLQNYIAEKYFLETDGEYDPEKTINAIEFFNWINETKLYSSVDPMEISISDLLVYANQTYGYTLETYDDSAYYSDQSETAVAESTGNSYDILIPKGYKSFADYAKQNQLSEDYCIECAMTTAGEIISFIEDYQSSTSAYDVENTNIRFRGSFDSVSGSDKNSTKTYTNMTSGDFSKDCSEPTFYGRGSVSLEVAVDLSFPVHDRFYNQYVRYQKIVPYYKWYIAGCIVGALGWLITLIYLIVLAGYTDETKKVKLVWLDRIYTELAAGIWIIIGLAIFVPGANTLFNFMNEHNMGSFVCTLILTGAFEVAFMSAILSLTRRIKANTIASQSLCSLLKRGACYAGKHMELTAKILGSFAIYMVAMVICYLIGGGMGLLLILLLNFGMAYILIRDAVSRKQLVNGVKIISDGDLNHKIDVTEMSYLNKELGEGINSISEGLQNAVAASVKNERMKTDLITNVSHDIKTPLTSIINYVDLLKREKIEDKKIEEYIDVLDRKSQRLKQLTDDLVEASKISSGNISLELTRMDFNELLAQTIGEFKEKFEAKNLEIVVQQPADPVVIIADGRRVWRIVENLFNNVCKYAMAGTRVYILLQTEDDKMTFQIKNISEHPLNINADELTERFIRGDVSRSTEGSGLGLSIAKNLTKLLKGEFNIYLDGDLFKVTVTFLLTD